MSYKIMRSSDGKFLSKKGFKISWGKGYEYCDLNTCHHVINEINQSVVQEIRSQWGRLYITTIPKFEVPVITAPSIDEQVVNRLSINQYKLVCALLNPHYSQGNRSKNGLLRETGLSEENLQSTIESLGECISVNNGMFKLRYDILLNNYSV